MTYKLLRTILLTFVFTVLMAGVSFAQCEQCKATNYGFYCVSASSGGKGCQSDGNNCTLTGLCKPGPAPVLGGPTVTVAPTTIREIAKVHPRFAATLAILREVRGYAKCSVF